MKRVEIAIGFMDSCVVSKTTVKPVTEVMKKGHCINDLFTKDRAKFPKI